MIVGVQQASPEVSPIQSSNTAAPTPPEGNGAVDGALAVSTPEQGGGHDRVAPVPTGTPLLTAGTPHPRPVLDLLGAVRLAARSSAAAPAEHSAAAAIPVLPDTSPAAASAGAGAGAGASAGSGGSSPIALAGFLLCMVVGAWSLLHLLLNHYRATFFLSPLERPG